MSKVISFSISDRYLDKIRSLYPNLTENLAAKQFLIDQLDASLDVSLDNSLDAKLRILIEKSLGDRLDATEKSISKWVLDFDNRIKDIDQEMKDRSIAIDDQIKAIEARLDDKLDANLDDSLDDSLDGILDERTKTLIETSLDGILDERLDAVVGKLISSLSERLSRLEERLDDSLDDGLDDNMERLLKREKECSIGPVPSETDSIEPVTGEGTVSNRQGLTNQQLSEKTRVPLSTIEKWKGKIKQGKEFIPRDCPDFFKQWRLNLSDSLWYEVD